MKKILFAALLISFSAHADSTYTGQILGGLAGGILGNQLGGGTGKVVTTAIGAVIGSQVGSAVQRSTTAQRVQPTVTPNQIQYQAQDLCSGETYYLGQYNPSAAQNYCRGRLQYQRQRQEQLNIDAFNSGAMGE